MSFTWGICENHAEAHCKTWNVANCAIGSENYPTQPPFPHRYSGHKLVGSCRQMPCHHSHALVARSSFCFRRCQKWVQSQGALRSPVAPQPRDAVYSTMGGREKNLFRSNSNQHSDPRKSLSPCPTSQHTQRWRSDVPSAPHHAQVNFKVDSTLRFFPSGLPHTKQVLQIPSPRSRVVDVLMSELWTSISSPDSWMLQNFKSRLLHVRLTLAANKTWKESPTTVRQTPRSRTEACRVPHTCPTRVSFAPRVFTERSNAKIWPKHAGFIRPVHRSVGHAQTSPGVGPIKLRLPSVCVVHTNNASMGPTAQMTRNNTKVTKLRLRCGVAEHVK